MIACKKDACNISKHENTQGSMFRTKTERTLSFSFLLVKWGNRSWTHTCLSFSFWISSTFLVPNIARWNVAGAKDLVVSWFTMTTCKDDIQEVKRWQMCIHSLQCTSHAFCVCCFCLIHNQQQPALKFNWNFRTMRSNYKPLNYGCGLAGISVSQMTVSFGTPWICPEVPCIKWREHHLDWAAVFANTQKAFFSQW